MRHYRHALALLALVWTSAVTAQSVPWYFVVTAVNSNGGESAYSTEATKIMGPGDSVTLRWNPPLLNDDGSPLTNLAGYRFYAGTQPGTYPLSTSVSNAGLTSFVWADVAGPVVAPGPVGNLVVMPVVAPPPGVGTITLTGIREFRFVVPAGMRASIRIVPTGTMFDWLNVGGVAGTPVPTTPPLGAVNNDGVLSNSITVDGPVNAIADTDGSVPTGFVATVDGVTKTFVQSGTTWSASFP